MGGPKGQVVVCFFLSHAFMFSKINLAEKEMATRLGELVQGSGQASTSGCHHRDWPKPQAHLNLPLSPRLRPRHLHRIPRLSEAPWEVP